MKKLHVITVLLSVLPILSFAQVGENEVYIYGFTEETLNAEPPTPAIENEIDMNAFSTPDTALEKVPENASNNGQEAPAIPKEKIRVAIYMTGDDKINEIVADRLMYKLLGSGKYQPIERSAAFQSAISKEHSFERTGVVDEKQIAKLGKQFGVQYVCVVSIVDVWQTEKYISARMIDVNSAEVIFSVSANGELTDNKALLNLMDYLTDDLTDAYDRYKDPSSEKVAVYVTKTGNRDVDIVLGDQLVAGFARSENYIAVERTNVFLNQLQKENAHQLSGAVDDDKIMARLGKMSGVKYVCVVKTTKYGDAFFINSRLVDVETAEVKAMDNLENIEILDCEDVISYARGITQGLGCVSEVVIIPDVNPEFPGGEAKLHEYLAESIRYPDSARYGGITGKVYVQFVVEKNGEISNVQVKRNIGGGCGDEAKRVVSTMPRWRPGRVGGRRVRSQFILPINFILK